MVLLHGERGVGRIPRQPDRMNTTCREAQQVHADNVHR